MAWQLGWRAEGKPGRCLGQSGHLARSLPTVRPGGPVGVKVWGRPNNVNTLWAVGGGRDEFRHHRGGLPALTAEPAASPLPRPPAPRAASAPALVTKFLVPDVIFGVGVLSQVGDVVRRHGGVRVFVVSDQGVADAGWTAKRSGTWRAQASPPSCG